MGSLPPLNRDHIILAYRLMLHREPESEEVIDQYLRTYQSPEEVGDAIMRSAEFQRIASPRVPWPTRWVSTLVHDGRARLWVDLSDRAVSLSALNDAWEPEETAFMKARLRPGDIVLDIGANIGWFTTLAALCVGKEGRVFAFEPNPVIAQKLALSISDSKLNDVVTLWQLALGTDSHQAYLSLSPRSGNPGAAFLSSHTVPEHENFLVRVVKLDDICSDVCPSFIKIDVEGWEPQVFQGGRLLLEKSKPTILSELHPDALTRRSNCTPREYIEMMSDLGFECFLLSNGKPGRRLHDYPADAQSAYVSCVFEPRSV